MLQTAQTPYFGGGSGPLISVCLPSYNNEDFIAATLDSILKQTYRNFEIIVTDDHSSDKTVPVVQSFADSRVTLIQNETNLGLAGNWNKAMSHATGKYIKVLGADDLLYPQCLQRQMEALENPVNSDVVLAVCGTDVINAAGQIVLRRKPRFRPGRVSGKRLIRNSVRWGTNRVGEPVVGLFKRDVLARSGMFDPANPYMIDLVFWAELLKHGDAFMDRDRLAAFRISAGSVSTKIGLLQAASFRSFVRKMRTDPVYRVNAAEAWMGSVLSVPWCVLRNMMLGIQRVKLRRNRC